MGAGYSGLELAAACLTRSRLAVAGPAAAAGQADQSASDAAAVGTCQVVEAGLGSLALAVADHIPYRTPAEGGVDRSPFRAPAQLQAYLGSHVARPGPGSGVVDSGSDLVAAGLAGNHQIVAVAYSPVVGRGIGSAEYSTAGRTIGLARVVQTER